MKTAHFLSMLAIIGMIVALMGSADAATVRGQIVYARDSSPAPYIAVRLISSSRGPSEYAYSGTDGRYSIPNVPAGSYQLEVSRGGKVVQSIAINVQEPVADAAQVRLP